METLGQRIRRAREFGVLTHSDVICMIDFSRSAEGPFTCDDLERWEAGDGVPSPARLDVLAHVFGCTTGWLDGSQPPLELPPSEATALERLSDNDAAEILQFAAMLGATTSLGLIACSDRKGRRR